MALGIKNVTEKNFYDNLFDALLKSLHINLDYNPSVKRLFVSLSLDKTIIAANSIAISDSDEKIKKDSMVGKTQCGRCHEIYKLTCDTVYTAVERYEPHDQYVKIRCPKCFHSVGLY